MKTLSRGNFIGLSLTSSLTIPFWGCDGLLNKERNKQKADVTTPQELFIDNIGFQVFTLRDLLVENATTLFRSLADIGIKNIEFFNPATLNDYVPIVRDCGMTPLCTHFMPGYISGKWESARQMGMPPPENYFFENIIEDCNRNGIKYMGIAIILDEERETMDDYKRFAEQVNQCAEKCKAAGIQLYYHNHSFEFEPNGETIPYDVLLNIFDPELVRIELDVFWLTVAGLDPLRWMKKIGNRLLFLHIKDLKEGTPVKNYTFNIPSESFVEIGSGIIDFKQIFTEAGKLGIRYAFIDQDHTQMEDKMESVRMSYKYIEELGV